MKQPKKPTRIQKEYIKAAGLDWRNWNVIKDLETTMEIVNKKTGTRRTIRK